MRSLGAQSAAIGGMFCVSFDDGCALCRGGGADAAPHAAIGAGGADCCHTTPCRASARLIRMRPASTLTGMTRVHPLSSPSASPVMSEMRQLCRSEEHTSELQSLMRSSYAVLCLKKKIYFKKY